jgi:predicted dehydrogenase
VPRQKPLATTLADPDRIIAAVRHAGVKFSLAFPMRHDPVNQQIYGTAGCRAVGQVAVVRRRHATG